MKIRDVSPGTTVTIKEGPAKGRVVTVLARDIHRRGTIGITDGKDSQAVRGDLDVEVVK